MTEVDSIFAEFDGVPGCAVGVWQAGSTVHLRGYGLSRLEPPLRVTPDTSFHAASLTKQMTALIVFMLQAEGRLDLDDELQKHVPEIPTYDTPIRIRHLLYHTSGLPDQWGLVKAAGFDTAKDDVTNDDVLNLVAEKPPLRFTPGTQFEYSNTGYVLLAEVSERVTAERFADLLETRVLHPLDMLSSRIRRSSLESFPTEACGYLPEGAGFRRHSPKNRLTIGPSGLQTAVEDLGRWADNFDHKQVGGGLVDLLSQPGTLDDGTRISYGGGQFVAESPMGPLMEHGGQDAAFTSVLARYTDRGLVVAVLCNNEAADAVALGRKVASLFER